MKKKYLKTTTLFLSTLFVIGVLILPVSHSAYAQDPGEAPDYSPTGINQGRGDIGSVITKQQIENDPALGGGTRASTGDKIVPIPSWSLSGLVIGIVGYFLYIMVSLLNASIEHFILGMGVLVNGPLKESIDLVWGILRDIVNLTFIFGLVYVGFKTILNAGSDTKKLLASIIIGALLVNFSLFISKVVIDVSNVTAIQIYNQMGIGANAQGTNLAGLNTGEAFMAQLGIIRLVAVPDPNVKGEMTTKSGGWNTDGEAALPFTIGLAIFVIVAAFVFATAALLITIRFGVLVFLMVLSPIAFAASVFPTLASWSKKWWHSLFEQSFFAPALFFMLYITMKVANGYQNSMQNFEGIFVGSAAQKGFTTAVFFCLTITLMVGSIIIAKQMGAYGASRALSVGGKSANFLRRSAQGYALRNTVGRGSELLGKGNNYLEGSRTGRNFKRGLSVLSLGTLTERTRQNLIQAGTKAKFGGSYSRDDDVKFWDETKKRRSQEARKREFNTAVKAGTADGAGDAELDAMEKAVQRATTAELEELGADILEKVGVAFTLTESQMEGVMKSDKFTAAQKENISNARRQGLIDSKTFGGEAALESNLKKASASQLETIGTDTLINKAGGLSASQLDDIKKSKKFTEREHTKIKEARELALKKEFSTDPAAFFAKRKATELAKMPSDILTSTNATSHLTGEIVRRIHDGDELNATDRDKIVENVRLVTNSSVADYLSTPHGRSFSSQKL